MTQPHPLDPTEIAFLLEAGLAALGAELAALPERVLLWRPAPGEWSAKQVVGHLIETEQRGFAGRIRTLLAGTERALQGWDPDEVAQARGDDGIPVSRLLDELTALRRDSVALVRGLRPADLPRAGQHPKVGRLSVADLLQEWVHHDRNHLVQIMANVQGFVWPDMGNARRFSQPG